MPRLLAPCGTPAAYRRHKHNGEPVDDDCRTAYNAHSAAYHREHGGPRARQRAFRELARRYREAFRTLHAEEIAKEPLRGDSAWKRARQRAYTQLAKRYREAFAALLTEEKAKEAST